MAAPQSSLIAPDGTIDSTAWLNYWSALWSAPQQPGYAQLVREGIARLVQFASSLETIARTGPPGPATDSLIADARSIGTALGGYGLLAFTSNDGSTLQTRVVAPLLNDVEGPLWGVARLQAKLVAVSGIIAPDWTTTLKREIVDPLAGAAKRTLGWVPIAIGIGVVWYLTRGSS